MEHENVKDKISKLLRLGESANGHEAKLALKKAHELLYKHKLTKGQVQDHGSRKITKQGVGIFFTFHSSPWVSVLSRAIGDNFCCVSFSRHRYGGKLNEVGFIGFKDDWHACAETMKYAYGFVISETRKLEKELKAKGLPAKSVTSLSKSYGGGFALGLHRMFEREKENNMEWGLVMAVPAEVAAQAEALGKPKGRRIAKDDSMHAHAIEQRGIQDGERFRVSRILKSEAAKPREIVQAGGNGPEAGAAKGKTS
jgi:hypothetical protein